MTLAVFDIDGTLTNTQTVDDVCFLKSVKDCWGCDLEEVDWGAYRDVTDAGLAQAIFRDQFNKEISETEILRLKHLFFTKIIAESTVNPEAF